MKRILIIGSDSRVASDQGEITRTLDLFKGSVGEFQEPTEILHCTIDLIAFVFKDGNFMVYDSAHKTPLTRYDLVVFKGFIRRSYVIHCITRYLDSNNIPVINGYHTYRVVNKLIQLVDMQERGIPFPDSVYAENPEVLKTISQEYLKFPLIVKPVSSSGGRGSYKLNSPKALDTYAPSHKDANVIIQTYIENSGDYRILIIGDKMLVTQRKQAPGAFLNNISQGGTEVLAADDEVPEQIRQQAKALADHMQLDIAGVDIIKGSNGTFYFLETNSQPGLSNDYIAENKKLLKNLLAAKIKRSGKK